MITQSPKLAALIDELRKRNCSIAFAESCTGGLLSAMLASVSGVSDIFHGSVVGYANQVKENVLGVSGNSLKVFGAVSEPVAREMVRGVCEKLNTKCGIAITGIAGPTGGSPEKPIGTVFFAFKGPGFEEVQQKHFAGSRQEIQQKSAEFAIETMLSRILTASH